MPRNSSVPAPHSLDFSPHVCPLAQDLAPAGVAQCTMAPGRTRLFTFGDRLVLLDAGQALVELDTTLGRRHQLAIDDAAPGFDSDVLLVSGAQVLRWAPGAAPAPLCGFDSAPAVLAGLPDDRVLLRDGPYGASRLALFDARAGRTLWTVPSGSGSAVVPWEDSAYLESAVSDVVMAVDLATGKVRWRSSPVPGGLAHPVGVVGERLWVATRAGSVVALDLERGRVAAECRLRANRDPDGIVDEAGRYHACNGINYQILDLMHGGAMETFDAFTAGGSSTALGRLAALASDGRLVFADYHGAVFVVHPDRRSHPERLLIGDTPVMYVGISENHLITLDRAGTLRIFGAAE